MGKKGHLGKVPEKRTIKSVQAHQRNGRDQGRLVRLDLRRIREEGVVLRWKTALVVVDGLELPGRRDVAVVNLSEKGAE